jgi:Meiotically up-regulated gene 113
LGSKDSSKELEKQKVLNSFKTVSRYLEDLATGREYKPDDVAVQLIQQWALENSSIVWCLLGLRVVPESIDNKGRMQNSAIAIANKILKKIGCKAKRTSQKGSHERRISVYCVTNSQDERRSTIYEFLRMKYGESEDNESRGKKHYDSKSSEEHKSHNSKVSRNKPQDVYIIQCSVTFMIKIGISNNPKRRLAEIQTYYPYSLCIARIIPTENARKLEFSLHKSLHKFRLKGEWFDGMALHEITLKHEYKNS